MFSTHSFSVCNIRSCWCLIGLGPGCQSQRQVRCDLRSRQDAPAVGEDAGAAGARGRARDGARGRGRDRGCQHRQQGRPWLRQDLGGRSAIKKDRRNRKGGREADGSHTGDKKYFTLTLNDMNGNEIESDEDSVLEGVPDVFRVKKSNLPPQAPSPLLSNYLGATWSELQAESTEKKWYSNTSKEQLVALGALKKAQQEGLITIKQADKGGGWVLMNQSDYISEMEDQLQVQFKQADGSKVPFYKKSNENELKETKTQLARLIEVGNKEGFISDSDAKEWPLMVKQQGFMGNPKSTNPSQRVRGYPCVAPYVANLEPTQSLPLNL